MKEIKEILKEVSYVIPQEGEQDFLTVVDLSDAIMITKDLYSREQVEELLKKQRKICAIAYFDKEQNAKTYGQICDLIESASSPLGERL